MLPHGIKLSLGDAVDSHLKAVQPNFGDLLNNFSQQSSSPQSQANGVKLRNPEGHKLFQNDNTQTKSASKSTADALVPGDAGGSVDVVSDYRWTPIALGAAAKSEIPYIYLQEFKYGKTGFELLQQKIRSSMTASVVMDTDPYDGLYSYDSPTDFHYTFPFFTDTYYDLNTSFKDANISLDDIAGSVEKFAGAVGSAKLAAGISIARDVAKGAEGAAEFLKKMKNPGGSTGKLDIPKIWDSTTPRKVSFKFNLFNTIDYKDIALNWELVYLLRYQNALNKQTLVTALPPVFYTVYIPGQHFSPASWIDSLRITNVGTTRKFEAKDVGLPQPGDVHIPDAYSIEISLTDMVMPSQNLLTRMKSNNITVVRKSKGPETYAPPSLLGDVYP